MIYLAPLQGFTDFVYRKAYSLVFSDVDAYFVPYVSIKDDGIPSKYVKEIVPENNTLQKVIPQVLVKTSEEILFLAERLKEYGYHEINLNLGCPYPMVTKREKGSGLLPHPEKLRIILTDYFENSGLKLSVKMRAGLISSDEIEPIISVLNEFPITEVIFHPRIAKQLYSGEILDEVFQLAVDKLKHPLIYNGDVFSVSDFQKRQQQFPQIENWMLGRGILMNPFLPSEIKGATFSGEERREKLTEFHRLMLDGYLNAMDNEGNALNKMQQFWIYFSYNFPNQKKVIKQIKKSKNMRKYKDEAMKVLRFSDL
jgi:tRNA-dihydrouridine synthase